MDYIVLLKVYQGIDIFLQILQYILVAYALLSWIVSPVNRFYQILSRMAQPLVAPFRGIATALIRRGFRIDVSVLLALLVLSFLRGQLPRIVTWIMGGLM